MSLFLRHAHYSMHKSACPPTCRFSLLTINHLSAKTSDQFFATMSEQRISRGRDSRRGAADRVPQEGSLVDSVYVRVFLHFTLHPLNFFLLQPIICWGIDKNWYYTPMEKKNSIYYLFKFRNLSSEIIKKTTSRLRVNSRKYNCLNSNVKYWRNRRRFERLEKKKT